MSAIRRSGGNQSSSNALRWGFYLLIGLSVAGLVLRVTARTSALAEGAARPTAAPTATNIILPALGGTLAATDLPATTSTPEITSTPSATPTETPIPAATQTAIYVASCANYDQIQPDLLTYVDRTTALLRDFEPGDLEIVPLETNNVAFRPIPMRTVVHRPLLDMLDAMNKAGLSIWVMSGYRSYSEQSLAFEKWQNLYPDRATDISAMPGHSEHQLGTAVDFSTPYMDDLYADFFHINFSQTAEGQWLLRQAAYYGFTLSYPPWAIEQTGYAWEPWHFRYVGSLALELYARNITLTQYLQQCAPQPAP
jgi:D-alanyl-D-alanine carboxypeptidase